MSDNNHPQVSPIAVKPKTSPRLPLSPVPRGDVQGAGFVVHFKKQIVNPYVSKSPNNREHPTYRSQIWPEKDSHQFANERFKTSNEVAFGGNNPIFYRTMDSCDMKRQIDVEEARSNIAESDLRSSMKSNRSARKSQLSKSPIHGSDHRTPPKLPKPGKKDSSPNFQNQCSPKDPNLNTVVNFDPENQSLDLEAPSQRGANYGAPEIEKWRLAQGFNTLELDMNSPQVYIPRPHPKSPNVITSNQAVIKVPKNTESITQTDQNLSPNPRKPYSIDNIGIDTRYYSPQGDEILHNANEATCRYDVQHCAGRNKEIAGFKKHVEQQENQEKYEEERYNIDILNAVNVQVIENDGRKKEAVQDIAEFNMRIAQEKNGPSKVEQARFQRERVEEEARSYMESVAKEDL